MPNKYKYMLKNFINSLDIKRLIKLKQIDLLSNNISNFKDNLSDFELDNDLSDKSSGQ